MSRVIELTNGLWAGFDNQQVKGDDVKIIRQTAPIRNSQYNIEKWIAQAVNDTQPQVIYVNGQPVATTGSTTGSTTATGGNSDLGSFVSNNKWLLLAGVGLVAFMMMSGNGGLLEATTVKRYAGRK